MIISKRYIREVKNMHNRLSEQLIQKDLILSYILQELSTIPQLIFKGGTCLSKCYLNYHRLSEDLDFTIIFPKQASKSAQKKQQRTFIKTILLPKLDEIASTYNLDFSSADFSTQGTRYCPVKNADNIFIFHMYSDKSDTHPIKIEINVSEQLIFPTALLKICNLHPTSNNLAYPLRNEKIQSYVLDEIVLEKARAILTRPEGIQERDLFDLFMLNSKCAVFEILVAELVQTKLHNSHLQTSGKQIRERISQFQDYRLFTEIDNMTLIDFDRTKYQEFVTKLFTHIVKIQLT